jgi:hypothetical protein
MTIPLGLSEVATRLTPRIDINDNQPNLSTILRTIMIVRGPKKSMEMVPIEISL